VAQLFSLGHEAFFDFTLLIWLAKIRAVRFRWQDFGSSFGFSSRRFDRRASAALADLRALGFAIFYYEFHDFVA
jgi:hypothetical protein